MEGIPSNTTKLTMTDEIPDAYKEAVKHTEKKPCNQEILEQWTMQKTVQRSRKNTNASAICSFWNCNELRKERDYLAD